MVVDTYQGETFCLSEQPQESAEHEISSLAIVIERRTAEVERAIASGQITSAYVMMTSDATLALDGQTALILLDLSLRAQAQKTGGERHAE